MDESILGHKNVEAVRAYLAVNGYIAVLHWHCAGARRPTPLGFAEFDEYHDYLLEHVRPGDAIDVWPFPGDEAPRLASGKKPSADGTIPARTPY